MKIVIIFAMKTMRSTVKIVMMMGTTLIGISMKQWRQISEKMKQ